MENVQYSTPLRQLTENLIQACLSKQGNLLSYVSENYRSTSIFRPSFTKHLTASQRMSLRLSIFPSLISTLFRVDFIQSGKIPNSSFRLKSRRKKKTVKE